MKTIIKPLGTINSRGLIIIIILLCLAILSFYLASDYLVSQQIIDAKFQDLTSLASARAQTVRQVTDRWSETTRVVSTLPGIHAVLMGEPEAHAGHGTRFVEDLAQTHVVEGSLSIINSTGIVIGSGNHSLIGRDWGAREGFLKALNGSFASPSRIVSFEDKNIEIGSPVLDKREGNSIGAVILTTTLSKIEDIMTDRTGLGKTGETFLVDSDYRMITPSRFLTGPALHQEVITKNIQNCFEHADPLRPLTHSDRTPPDYIGYREVAVVAVHVYLPETGWCLVANVDREEALEPLNKIRTELLLITIFIVIIITILSSYFARSISVPLQRLTHAIHQITTGDLGVTLPKSSIAEINDLTSSLNRIIASMKLAMIRTGARAAEIGLGGTAPEKIEKALMEAESKYVSFVENLPGIAYRCRNDSDRTMEIISEGVEDFTGYSSSDFIENKVRAYDSIIHPDDRKRIRKEIQKAVRDKKSYECEYRIIDSHKIIQWAHERGRGVYDSAGRLNHLDGIIINITGQKEAQLQLSKTQEGFSRLTQSLGSRYFVYRRDEKGKFIEVSPQVMHLLGYTPKEFSRNIRRVMPRAFVDKKLMQCTAKICQSKKPNIFGVEITSKKGEHRFFEMTENIVTDDKFKIVAIEGIAHDITDRMAEAEQIRSAKKMYDHAASATNQMAYEYDFKKETIIWSGAIKKVAGYTPIEIEKKEIKGREMMIHPADRKGTLKALDRALKKNKPYDLLYRLRRKDGSYVHVRDIGRFESGGVMFGTILLVSGNEKKNKSH